VRRLAAAFDQHYHASQTLAKPPPSAGGAA
jgi:hypothetical protein